MNALDRLGAEYELTDDAQKILAAEKVIFPGVGHAKHAMDSLKNKGLVDVIKSVSQPLLGICVGMQLLYECSEEGNTDCLGIIEGTVKKFDDQKVIVPQVGWNTNFLTKNRLFQGLKESIYLYAVHSFRADVGAHTISTSTYGTEYSSAVQFNNFYGVQFHPEKSSKDGQLIIKNFLEL
jgi:glutamine amidotransferase